MARRPTDYAAFRAIVDQNYSALTLPSDCKESHPLDIVRVTPDSWHLRWYLEFSDNKYVRIAERYEKFSKMMSLSRRINVAYHYGEITRRGPDSLPGHLASDPVDMRIDDSCGAIHLHYNSQNPHHPNDAVKGLDLDDLDMFGFVNGIFKHRANQKPLHVVFGFKV